MLEKEGTHKCGGQTDEGTLGSEASLGCHFYEHVYWQSQVLLLGLLQTQGNSCPTGNKWAPEGGGIAQLVT